MQVRSQLENSSSGYRILRERRSKRGKRAYRIELSYGVLKGTRACNGHQLTSSQQSPHGEVRRVHGRRTSQTLPQPRRTLRPEASEHGTEKRPSHRDPEHRPLKEEDSGYIPK